MEKITTQFSLLKIMKPLHPWDVTIEEAIRIQEDLKGSIVLENRFLKWKTIAGADASYSRHHPLLWGTIAVLTYPELELLDQVTVEGEVNFPYIPGLFSFREGPVLLKAFQKLKIKPDLILFDGHGIAHPRGIGLASHLGLWLDLPSIGCARTSLIKESTAPEKEKGSVRWIYREGEKVGAALRTREGVNPLFVSPGHRIDLMTSLRIVLSTCKTYRLPEPLRKAHQISRNRIPRP